MTDDEADHPPMAPEYLAPTFLDAGVAAALEPLVHEESVTWRDFTHAVDRLARLAPGPLVALHRDIVDALVDGRYVAVDPGPVDVFSITQVSDDADVPFGGLSYALIDLDYLRESHGAGMVRTSIEDRLARPSLFPADLLMLCLRLVPAALRSQGLPDPVGVAPWDVEEEFSRTRRRQACLSLGLLTSQSRERRYVVQRFDAADARGVDALRIGEAHQWEFWKLHCEWQGDAGEWTPKAPAALNLPEDVEVDDDFVGWVARAAAATSANRTFADRVLRLDTPAHRDAASAAWGWLSPDAWLYLRAAAALETSAPTDWLRLSPEAGEEAVIRLDFEGTQLARDLATDESRHFHRIEGPLAEVSTTPRSGFVEAKTCYPAGNTEVVLALRPAREDTAL